MSKEEAAKNLKATAFAEKLSMFVTEQVVTDSLTSLNVRVVERVKNYILTNIEDGTVNLSSMNFQEVQDISKTALKEALLEIAEDIK